MAAASNALIATFKDRLGKVARVVFRVLATITDPADTTIATLRAAIIALLRVVNPEVTLSIPAPQSVTAGTSDYSNIEDRILMRMLDANGKTHTFRLPGPKDDIFLDDGETVDGTNTDVLAWVSAVTTHAVTKGGAAFTQFLGGRRSRKRPQKK